MEITTDLVRYLEALGRIELSPEDELDTTGVEPLSHALGRSNVMREDTVSNGDMRDTVLSNAPETKEGTILVPRTFD